MRLIVFRHGDGEPKAGVLLNEYVVDISEYGDRSTVDGGGAESEQDEVKAAGQLSVLEVWKLVFECTVPNSFR